MKDRTNRQNWSIEERLIALEAETRELYLRLHQRDKAFDVIRRAYIGIREEDR